VLLEPVMPEKMAQLGKILGYAPGELGAISDLAVKESDLAGRIMTETEPLFPRILVEDKEEAKAAPAKKEKQPQKEEKPVNLISIDDFFKAELKTAKILAAEAVPEADKLLKLQIDVGGVPRQIVAGIAKSYTPESLIGKTIVIVSNLQPAKIRGIESCGMLLAAKAGKELKLVTVDGEIASGASVG
ncbi:MAG: methionine--tRNA ligase subunit beta, partial [Lentisphaeria bacterium]|nr:methionine--tRNA ligase subunit beta [Lentisphaeria bacterium]